MNALVPRGTVCVPTIPVELGWPVDPLTPFAGVAVWKLEFAELAVEVMFPLFAVETGSQSALA
jgi:hypothetical protein